MARRRFWATGLAVIGLSGWVVAAVLLTGAPVGWGPAGDRVVGKQPSDGPGVLASATPAPPELGRETRDGVLVGEPTTRPTMGTPTPVGGSDESLAARRVEASSTQVSGPLSSPTASPARSTSTPAADPSATAATSTTPTPGPRAMTVYAVTNPNAVTLDVEHVITDPSGFRHSFWSRVPPNSTAEYHLRDIVEVPSPFRGSLDLYADRPFTARIVGYDYP